MVGVENGMCTASLYTHLVRLLHAAYANYVSPSLLDTIEPHRWTERNQGKMWSPYS